MRLFQKYSILICIAAILFLMTGCDPATTDVSISWATVNDYDAATDPLPEFENNWSSWNTDNIVMIGKDSFGYVHVRGVALSATDQLDNDAIIKLPAAYTPKTPALNIFVPVIMHSSASGTYVSEYLSITSGGYIRGEIETVANFDMVYFGDIQYYVGN